MSVNVGSGREVAFVAGGPEYSRGIIDTPRDAQQAPGRALFDRFLFDGPKRALPAEIVIGLVVQPYWTHQHDALRREGGQGMEGCGGGGLLKFGVIVNFARNDGT